MSNLEIWLSVILAVLVMSIVLWWTKPAMERRARSIKRVADLIERANARRAPTAGWGIIRPSQFMESDDLDLTTPNVLRPSPKTLSLLEALHKIEYDLLAEGSHDAFRDDHRARIPLAVHAELDYMDARASSLVIQSINYIRKNLGDEPLEIMPDFDDMLRRIIQRHEDEFNYPPTNFRY